MALARLRDRGAAEEAAQEAVLRLWRFRASLERADDAEAWIVRVAGNEAVRLRERRSRLAGRETWIETAVPKGELADPDAREDPGLRVAVMAELRRLADQDRRIVALHYFGDEPLPEVARRLGLPLGTVKARLSRARKRLADDLAA